MHAALNFSPVAQSFGDQRTPAPRLEEVARWVARWVERLAGAPGREATSGVSSATAAARRSGTAAAGRPEACRGTAATARFG